jgi:hypothetical protein
LSLVGHLCVRQESKTAWFCSTCLGVMVPDKQRRKASGLPPGYWALSSSHLGQTTACTRGDVGHWQVKSHPGFGNSPGAPARRQAASRVFSSQPVVSLTTVVLLAIRGRIAGRSYQCPSRLWLKWEQVAGVFWTLQIQHPPHKSALWVSFQEVTNTVGM